ncbi:MAG TPA: alpha-1,4-glucan--maltose-1-phosphate maltosyltransferase [Gemmatimonadaceae bacterium]|nr:alpha-1,4-glucan--maltose-1-phosphate maltosyltransferase [Gemmatimonadaceae bacterium]
MPNELPQSTTVATRKTDRRSNPRRAEFIVIECLTPQLDGGRHPVKRIVGDRVSVGADLIQAGHDTLGARVMYMGPGDSDWSASAMLYDYDSDRWYGAFVVDRIGRWKFTVEAWTDRFATWRSGLEKKVKAGQDVQLELAEGAQMARAASRSARVATARASLLLTAKMLEDRRDTALEKRIQRALDEDLFALMQEHLRPADLTRSHKELAIIVDRQLAGASAWYELFPRSQTTLVPGATPRHGTFDDAAARLPRLAELGFDVVYLPPIHPIGRTFRKGKNNSLTPEPDDVGSPWAIGNEDGGHTAIDPALGTLADFDRFVRTARGIGLEVALDYALQCSPDHPWVKEHPDWFNVRPDGSIQYAENPPKKYQDIYPLNFWCDDRQSLWNACRDVLRFWISHGVTIFRVDNPHTKALVFWEWVIGEIQREHPETIFFSEAFTRPKRMKALAKVGFTMSYTYFTWKNSSWDLREYFAELTQSPMTEYFRGNLFVNTPDILNEYLVHGGLPAFRARLLLAATLSPLYGMYSGFELGENVPVREGSEEYLDSEKYELRPRNYDSPGNINSDIAQINGIRRGHRAFQRSANLSFHTSENPAVLFYRKARLDPVVQWTSSSALHVPRAIAEALGFTDDGGDDILIAVNTDPHHVQETMVHVPIHEMGIDDDRTYVVRDLLSGARYTWRGVRNYVRLDPNETPGHLFLVEREEDPVRNPASPT